MNRLTSHGWILRAAAVAGRYAKHAGSPSFVGIRRPEVKVAMQLLY